ncbi:MAG TPA: hypothetical protein VGB37_14560 [Candidatus Lokiarchaeia archaeon]
MQKKQKRILFVGLVLAIVLIIFVNQLNFLTITTLSISSVDIKDFGQKILVYARQGGGQELEIQFTPNVLNQFLIDKGYKATETSILTAKYLGGQVNIPFSTGTSNTIKLLKSPVNIGITSSCTITTCKNKGYMNTVSAYRTGNLLDLNCYCTEEYNNGYVQAFNTGLSSNAFSVQWNLDGETKTMTSDYGYVEFGDSTKITWQGSLLGNNQIGVPNYQVFHIGTSWYLIDANSYSSVINAYNTFKVKVSSLNLAKSNYDSALSEYYAYVNSYIYSHDKNYLSSVPNANSLSFSEGIMTVNLNQPTFLPTYTIELNADRVGIIKLIGQPEIIQCVGSQTFNEAGSKNINLVIKNIGNSEASFKIYSECSNLISTNAQELDFDSGESRSVSLLLSGGNDGTKTNSGTCSIIVKDSNSNNQDTCNFGVDVKYSSGISECTGIESACSPDGRSLYQCESGIFIQKNCPISYSCKESFGNAKCEIDTSTPPLKENVCRWYELNCRINNMFGDVAVLINIIKWISLVITVLITFLFGQKKLNELIRKTDSTSMILKMVISIALASLVGFILYTLLFTWIFWLVILGVIGFFIILNFTPLGRILKIMGGR